MKTEQQIKTEVNNYLQKTSQHLFLQQETVYPHKMPYYFKIFPFKDMEGKNSFYQITFEEGGTYKVKIESADKFKGYKQNQLNVLKHILFLNKKYLAIKAPSSISGFFMLIEQCLKNYKSRYDELENLVSNIQFQINQYNAKKVL